MTVLSVGHDASARPPYYVRVQAGDLDGDGIADQADLKLVCTDGFLEQLKRPGFSGGSYL